MFTESEQLIAINENLYSGILETQAGFVVSTALLIAYLVNLYMLYTYVSFGKNLYLILFIVGIFLSLLSGDYAANAFENTLQWLAGITSGAILVLLYFSPIKDKFVQKIAKTYLPLPPVVDLKKQKRWQRLRALLTGPVYQLR